MKKFTSVVLAIILDACVSSPDVYAMDMSRRSHQVRLDVPFTNKEIG